MQLRVPGIDRTGSVFPYKLRYIVGFGLVEMAISTNPKPTIYRNLYENTAQAQNVWRISSKKALHKNKVMERHNELRELCCSMDHLSDSVVPLLALHPIR